MRRRYSVIYADPPWRYASPRPGYGGAEDHYPSMALDDIKGLQVPAAKNSVLFLWATMPLLRQALEVMEAWDFRYVSVGFCWVKQNPSGVGLVTGLGWWTKSNVEICLLGTRGHPRPASHFVRSVVISPRRRHSQKPAEARDRIVELMGNVPRLEMFARERTPGWDVWGNELKNSVEIKSRKSCGSCLRSQLKSCEWWRRCSIAS